MLSIILQREHALESMSANNVVDRLELQRRWKAGKQCKPPTQSWDAKTIPFGHTSLGFPAPNSKEFTRLDAQLQALYEMVDAVSDVVVAESVYHVVQGNLLRAGATLDAIATGKMPSPELEVVRTPRTGIGLTHRMLVLFSMSPDMTASGVLAKWNTNTTPVRAQAEPLLNAWPATLLGDPEQIRCRAAYVDRETDTVLHSTELSLNRLQLSSLDVVFMVEGNEEAQRSELEQRLLAQLLQTRPDGISHEAPLLLVQDGASIRLKRGALPRIQDGTIEGTLEPQGLILDPGHELLLQDEEVPREGARVTRSYQYSRWVDGSTHLWIGRRKQPGRSEGSSGLRFDIVEPT